MKRVGVLLIIAGLLFGIAIVGIITSSRSHISLLIVVGGSLTSAAEIAVGCLLLGDANRFAGRVRRS